MEDKDILNCVADEVDQALADHNLSHEDTPQLQCSKWVAASLLQKSIRRGETKWALAAANLLGHLDPARLWRRLAIIAIEDVGLGDLDAVYWVIAGLANRTRLVRRYGQSAFISLLVEKLSEATKCRASDDLYCLIDCRHLWAEERAALAEVDDQELAAVIFSEQALEVRAIAIRYMLGTSWPPSRLFPRRKGSPKLYFDLLVDHGYPQSLVVICQSAYRQTSEPLCGLIPILHQQYEQEMLGAEKTVRPDTIPFSPTDTPIPLWALDCFTHEGKTALKSILTPDNAISQWLHTHISKRSINSVMCEALFRVESGLVNSRLIWPTGMEFLRKAELTRSGVPEEQAAELLNQLRRDLPTLNQARLTVWNGPR